MGVQIASEKQPVDAGVLGSSGSSHWSEWAQPPVDTRRIASSGCFCPGRKPRE